MSFPVPLNAPKFVVDGITYAIGAFDWVTPFSNGYYVGIFVKVSDGIWHAPTVPGAGVVVQYLNQHDIINDMKAKGGRVKYLQWLFAQIELVLSTVFAKKSTVVVPSEPTNDQEAKDAINAAIPTIKILIVDGVVTIG